MNASDWQAEQFERSRSHLRAVAYRMLGSGAEADDAVQEAWMRFARTDTGAVENLRGWLTTVVSRVCLDMLRARRARREEVLEMPNVTLDTSSDPEQEALLADSVGLALLVVLETLSPAERLAFVLHDMFGMPFEEIAPIVGRNAISARQLASRARRRASARRSGLSVAGRVLAIATSWVKPPTAAASAPRTWVPPATTRSSVSSG